METNDYGTGVKVMRTDDDFQTWLTNIQNIEYEDRENIINIKSNCEINKPVWIFVCNFTGMLFYNPIEILCINYNADIYDIQERLLGYQITQRLLNPDGGFYHYATYIHIGKDIPDLSFVPDGVRIELKLHNNKYVKPIIKGHCYSFDIFQDHWIDGSDYIIDLSKVNIGRLENFEKDITKKLLLPFNVYIKQNMTPKIIL